MRIEVLTSLYPSASRPVEGLFAERRWLHMRARGHAVRVTQPLPFASRWLPLARWRALAEIPAHETRAGIEIERPRYLHWPGRVRANAGAFARAGLNPILARARPDVVVLDYAWPAAAAVTKLRERRIPCVVSGRGSDVLEVAGEAGLADELAFFLRSAGHWCAVSRDLLRVMDRLGNAEGRGVLVANGVDAELFRPQAQNEARRALGLALAPTERLVLVCGHLIERKDPLLALEVFARTSEAQRLVFLGRGPLERKLADAIRARGLEARVELRGEVEPPVLARWYAAADLLLLTSRREGRPNVVLEALSSGRPVLATDAGGTAEVLGELAERMLSRTREPAALAAQLGRLLTSAFEPAALRAAVAHLTWESSLQALERCLQAAMDEGA
ncbi:MAG: glycosyltransferase family 4 protein [Planctomycetes bacterium]|nr:glycosyltransferase family 4 protein [Planctomycetota bacterium]